MGHYLFSFRGRINRAKIWLFLLIVVVFEAVAVVSVVAALGPNAIADAAQHKALAALLRDNGAVHAIGAIAGLLLLMLIYAGFAVIVKRLHDRNKSAWWLLVFYLLPLVLNLPRQIAMLHALNDGTFMQVSQHGGAMALGGAMATLLGGVGTIISLWAFVELYILRGTVGDNRYGPDPLVGKDQGP